jgi:galactokinase
MPDLNTFFRESFGSSPTHSVHTPGRLELLGNHTDYNQGMIMSLAVDQYIGMASTPRNDGKIELISSAFPKREQFALDQIEQNPAVPWTNYVKGVLLQLRRCGVAFNGFNAAVHGTIPIGAGLSSSAALEVAAALTVRQLYPYALTEAGAATPPQRYSNGHLPPLGGIEKMALARICQIAESDFVGVHCGPLDQISCLLGKASHIIQIDCLHLTVKHDPIDQDIGVVVCNSGVNHDLTSGEYNDRRSHCEAAARALGVEALRFVTPEQLELNKTKLTARDYECAYHVIGENQRVILGERALREGNLDQFGQYLFQSHESSRDFFKNSSPELDLLVELARAQPGCLGARLTGGGFGGAAINLVQQHKVKGFCQAMARQYHERTGRDLEPLVCRIVDGAG